MCARVYNNKQNNNNPEADELRWDCIEALRKAIVLVGPRGDLD